MKSYLRPAFTSSIGVTYPLFSKFEIVCNLQLIAQRVRIKELTIDGKKIFYPYNQSYELPFSSLSTQVGIVYKF
jgi:hypothetical protein